MNSRLLLGTAALVLFAAGFACLFAPAELAALLAPGAPPAVALALQLAASGLLGFSMQNWMSRRNRIGGIYARPLGIGNLLLFGTAALSLGKAAAAGIVPMPAYAVVAICALLAAAFAWLVFVHDPLSDRDERPAR